MLRINVNGPLSSRTISSMLNTFPGDLPTRARVFRISFGGNL
jgi:hypothetical protein